MKLILAIFFSCSLFTASSQRDTTRRDTSWSRSPHRPFLLSIMQAPVLEGRATAVTIVPRERICFDKIFKLKTQTSIGAAEGCLFINTEKGLMASTPIKRGAAPPCDLNINRPDFGLVLIGLKGNTYNYFNAKKKDRLEHWVTTGNSENYQYQFISSAESIALTRRADSKLFIGGKAKAWAYKAEGRPETWWLFGKTEPERIMMTPKKFLGSYAVGYQYTDKGLFIIMQVTAPNYSAEVTDIQDMDICFDPSSFKMFEEEQNTQMTASIRRQREKIAKEEAKQEQEPACQSKKTILLNYQKESLNRQEQNMQSARQGNLSQNVRTQQAQADLMNYDDAIQQMIYETELKLCRAQQRQSRNPSQSTQRKIDCLQNALATQQQTKQQFQQINTQYRNEPGKQYSEKARAMMRAITPCD
jgi:hypothetical protein